MAAGGRWISFSRLQTWGQGYDDPGNESIDGYELLDFLFSFYSDVAGILIVSDDD